MALKLSKKTEDRVLEKVRSGSFDSPDAVIDKALGSLEAGERLRKAVAESEEDFRHGRTVTPDESRRRRGALLQRFRDVT